MTWSHYDVLGVSASASTKEIGRAYSNLAAAYRRGGSSLTAADFREIKASYEVLRDRQKRVRYDIDDLRKRSHRQHPADDDTYTIPLQPQFARHARGQNLERAVLYLNNAFKQVQDSLKFIAVARQYERAADKYLTDARGYASLGSRSKGKKPAGYRERQSQHGKDQFQQGAKEFLEGEISHKYCLQQKECGFIRNWRNPGLTETITDKYRRGSSHYESSALTTEHGMELYECGLQSYQEGLELYRET